MQDKVLNASVLSAADRRDLPTASQSKMDRPVLEGSNNFKSFSQAALGEEQIGKLLLLLLVFMGCMATVSAWMSGQSWRIADARTHWAALRAASSSSREAGSLVFLLGDYTWGVSTCLFFSCCDESNVMSLQKYHESNSEPSMTVWQ
jgi:hypothetical protein